MAIGASLLFNIWLPINFNSPYKAINIQDFWRRWHITLSHFLRDYLYIPLGGNRSGVFRTYLNLLGGLWHGATWMFVIWGAMHGSALVIHRVWMRLRYPMPTVLAWFLTFMFVNISWVFFRAKTLDDAFRVIGGMIDFRSAFENATNSSLVSDLAWGGWLSDLALHIFPASLIGLFPVYMMIIVAFVIVTQKNSIEMVNSSIGTWKLVYGATLFTVAMYFTLAATSSIFLYFTF